MLGEDYKHFIMDALYFEMNVLGGKSRDAAGQRTYRAVADVLGVKVGCEFLKGISGHVSTEVSSTRDTAVQGATLHVVVCACCIFACSAWY